MLAINFVQQIDEDLKVEFQLITSRGFRTISVNRAVNVLGKEHSRALFDHSGVFKGLTKSRCFNIFFEIQSATNGTILDVLSCLGTSNTPIYTLISSISVRKIFFGCARDYKKGRGQKSMLSSK